MKNMFFMPWNGLPAREVPRYQLNLYTIGGKRPLYLAADGFYAAKRPFLSIPSPGGTIRMFLSALKNGALDEASSYISTQYFGDADMEELKNLFQNTKGYQCYFSHSNRRNISVALGGDVSESIVSMDMIEEPNTFGKWKIWRIMKE